MVIIYNGWSLDRGSTAGPEIYEACYRLILIYTTAAGSPGALKICRTYCGTAPYARIAAASIGWKGNRADAKAAHIRWFRLITHILEKKLPWWEGTDQERFFLLIATYRAYSARITIYRSGE